jgi:hypothetical protein
MGTGVAQPRLHPPGRQEHAVAGALMHVERFVLALAAAVAEMSRESTQRISLAPTRDRPSILGQYHPRDLVQASALLAIQRASPRAAWRNPDSHESSSVHRNVIRRPTPSE